MKTSGTSGATGILAALLCMTLAAVVDGHDTAAAVTVLGTQHAQFIINDEPAFLLGISYYAGLGAPEDFIRQDLDDFQRHGFNWLRVWATWGAFENDVSAVEASGEPREPFLAKLTWLVELMEGTKSIEHPVVQASLTRRYTARALDFIERHQKQPFFLYLAHTMPHKPLATTTDYYQKSGAGLYGDVLMDLFATALAAAGIGPPADRVIDGRDILPLFTSKAESPHAAVFGQQGDRLATVRDERWKLHVVPPKDNFANLHKPGEQWIDPRGPDGVTILAPYEQCQPSDHPGLLSGDASKPMQLFDLQTDPGEQKDVAAEHPEIVARLTALYDQTNHDVPTPKTSEGKSKKN